ncbi:unnamed protein product [Mycena citricolor]|uniref:Peptidase S9 prolyl oligopeptidase catalytic domain-containing protein n=1 Tax=Mycena citricolor TaxID=2018698 RepID=A0AAD2Q5Y4_9AGAR|nr:unnamed protein product [Mycena citricolor]
MSQVLGPFPIHAREQHYVSPSFPTLNLSQPIDFDQTWPSAYADNGRVAWSKAEASLDGDLKISFPEIRWSNLRATEGWAALQHHALLRSTLTVYPPTTRSPSVIMPQLLVQLIQGSYFSIVSPDDPAPAEWHAGNIYALERTLPKTVQLPTAPSLTAPTTYEIFVSGDYEIRLFGDPKEAAPTQSIRVSVDLETPSGIEPLKIESSQNVVADFLDGYSFGNALGLGVRNVDTKWWNVTSVLLFAPSPDFSIDLLRATALAPSQTRIVPLRIRQSAPFHDENLQIRLSLSSAGRKISLPVTISLRHLSGYNSSLLGTYFYAEEMPTAFAALPPLKNGRAAPPVLCLHGAGVDIQSQSFWIDSLPRQQHGWLVAPSGRTAWGLDWHGPSAKEAFDSVDALGAILKRNVEWQSWELSEPSPKVILMGHSNGGQGSWYLASRYPDRVLGVVPAAAYIKSQAYVSWAMSRSTHYIDPMTQAILDSSLTPDNNDLFLSNLIDTPILAIHGGSDDNVPVWHSREAVSVVQTWNPAANVSFREDPGELHWYPTILKVNKQVQDFLDQILQSPSSRPSPRYTLTVANPSESGSLHGWKVEQFCVPGRLARLTVQHHGERRIVVTTSNVCSFSLLGEGWSAQSVEVDNQLQLSPESAAADLFVFDRDDRREWTLRVTGDTSTNVGMTLPGRVQMFLSTPGPFQLIVLDKSNSRHLSLALRIAHDLNAYHRLDAEILMGYQSDTQPKGNVLIISDTHDPELAMLMKNSPTPFHVTNDGLSVRHRPLDQSGLGVLFLHPHPNNPNSRLLFLLGSDNEGLERAARLFPIRTGVAVPDWVITTALADQVGAAGILGAGVYGLNWSWNEATSWLY